MTYSKKYPIKTAAVEVFYFIGVTTANSAILKVFPRWMEILGHPEVEIKGIDHPISDDPEKYRATIAQIKYDPLSLGALVTTHKINLLEAGADLFDELHESSTFLREVSCISKKNGKLVAHAKDLLSSGKSLDTLLGKGYFGRTGGEVVCFGAGGSGKAISLHLMQKTDPADRPLKIHVTNRSKRKLVALEEMIQNLGTDIDFVTVHNTDPDVNDQIIANLPESSVVINATGMGKDIPGSPISDAARFPRNGVVWEINYRGELGFWHQAKSQEKERSLIIEDGWLYFLHGWTQVIAEVLDITLNESLFDELSAAAESLRPKLIYQPRTTE
jgi:shikimate 5-dehydrogenase